MLWYVGPAKRELTRSRERFTTFRTSVPCVVCLLATWACGGPVSLPDVKFQIPVPPEARLFDTTYADTGEDFMSQFRTVSWTLKSSNNLDDVIAFYKQMIFFYSSDRIYLEQDSSSSSTSRLEPHE